MKKQSIYAFMSAIALTGAVGFSSCSSSKDDVGEVSPNYNPNTNEALVEFVFNVAPGANHASTRQTADATQAYPLTQMTSNRFRGIEQAHVMCFTGGNDGEFLVAPATAAKDFDMARVAASTSLNKDKSTRVLEMSLPLNTNKMVFYGRAITNESSNSKNEYGHLDDSDGYNVTTNLTTTSFHLCGRLGLTEKTHLELIERLLSSILTCIMETNRGDDDVTQDGWTLNDDGLKKMKWSAFNTNDGKSPVDPNIDLTQLETKLAKVYKEMTTIRASEGELRNGSGPALLATITDLWTIVNGVRYATPTNKPEAMAKYVAGRIHIELLKYFSATVSSEGGPVTGVAFNSVADIVTSLYDDKYWPGTGDAALPDKTVFDPIKSYTRLSDFPLSFALPQGATHLVFNTSNDIVTIKDGYKVPTNGFYYAVNFNTSAVSGTFTVDDYYYPAELLYFGNSPLRVSDATYEATEYPTTTGTWDNTADGTWWKTPKDGHSWDLDGHVKSSTRSVAMANDINYGTALLETTVGYVSGTSDDSKNISEDNPLLDNNAYIQNRDYGVDEENNKIVPEDGDFRLVGILVGGQYPRVGWNFLPKLQAGEKQGYIYDNVIAGGNIPAPGGNTAPNYTLVFDNLNYDQSEGTIEDIQHTVYIALELENNTGSGFFGKDNLIPNGSHFYLIGALDPAAVSGDLTSPQHHALPPYNTDGTLNNVKRVFVQDHKTTVNFKIGKYSLQYAYLNIPDLRSSSVTLGLSVDLSWSRGIDFGAVVIGGDEQYPPTNP